MRALDDMDFEALLAYTRDLLHQRGEAAGDISRRRQELPYHPLLSQYEEGGEALRARLSRVALALLNESARAPWPVEALHYLLTLVEKLRLEPAKESLKSLVGSKAWLRQSEGPQRQMLALRTLLGLGCNGDPNFWWRQHEILDRSYPALIFGALAAHGLEYAFKHLGRLIDDAESTRQVVQFFPSLIEQHKLKQVLDLTKGAAAELSPEVVSTLSVWFERRGYGTIVQAEPCATEAESKTATWEKKPEHLRAGGRESFDDTADGWSTRSPLKQIASALDRVLRPSGGTASPSPVPELSLAGAI